MIEKSSNPVSLHGESLVFWVEKAETPLVTREEADGFTRAEFGEFPSSGTGQGDGAVHPLRRTLGKEELVPDLAEKESVDEHGPTKKRDVAREDASGSVSQLVSQSVPVSGNAEGGKGEGETKDTNRSMTRMDGDV